MLVPNEGEVGWYIDGKWEAVWKGHFTRFEYDFSRNG
jgi:hypothetical protein